MAVWPRGHASGAAMNWGARLLDRTATMVLLLQLLTWSPAGTYPLATRTARTANMTMVTLDKDRRDGDPISDILIEHVGDDDAVLIPLFIALLVVGAFVFLSLLLLGCLLVLRLCQSGSAKYHRLRSDDSDSHRYRSKTRRSRQSQVFTYVDLSNADCSCREPANEGQRQAPAPRFGVQFQTAANVDSNDVHQIRERQGAPSPAPRKSRMAGMGLPSGEDNADVQLNPRSSPTESNVNAPELMNASADRPAEQLAKVVGVQSPVGMPRSNGSSENEGEEFDTYRERCTQFRSVVPRLEINVRDRFVRRHASGGAGGRLLSPGRARADCEAESAVTAQTTETTYAFHPNLRSSPPTEEGSRGMYDISSDIHLSPTFSPGVPSVSSPYLKNRPRSILPCDSASEQTSPFGVEAMDASGHGGYYEELADSRRGKSATLDITAQRYSQVNSAAKEHQPVTVTSPSRVRHPMNALVEFPDNRITARNGSSLVTPRNSTKLRELVENGEAKFRQVIEPARKPSEEPRPSVTPARVDTNVITHRTPPPWPSSTHSPYQSSPRQMIHVPQRVASSYQPQTAKSIKTIAEEKPEPDAIDMSSSEGPSSVQHMAEASAPMFLKERTVSASEKLKLPQPPMQRLPKDLQAKLSDDHSAVISGSLKSMRKRRDDQSSTEPFSFDDLSHRQVSASGPFSEVVAFSDQADARKIAAVPPFIHPRSKPSFISPAPNSMESESAIVNGSSRLSSSSVEHVKEGRTLSVRVESTQGVEARADSVPLMMEERTQPPKGVVAREELSATSAALVRPFDHLESRTHAISGESDHVEEHPPPAVLLSENVTDLPAQPVTREGSWVQTSAQHQILAESGASGKAAIRSGGKESVLHVLAHSTEITGRNGTAPVELSAETDESSLTPKEPLVFPSSSESEDAVGNIEEYLKKKSLSDAAPPYATDLWTPFKVLSKEDRNALSSRKQERDTKVLPAQVLQKQLVTSKEEPLTEGKKTTWPTEDAKAQSGATEKQVIPEKRTLLFDDDVHKEPAPVRSFAAPSVSGPSGTQQPPVRYDVPAETIRHASIRGAQVEKGAAIIGRHDYTVPSEVKDGQPVDVASAHDKQIFVNENREAVERGPDGSSGEMATNGRHGAPLSSEDGQEQVERFYEKGKSLSKARHPSASYQLTSLPHADKLISREDYKVPANQSTNQEIWANVPQALPADREVSPSNGAALSDQTEVYPVPSAVAAQYKAEGNAILVGQSSELSSKYDKESSALEDTAGKTLPGQKLYEDAVLPSVNRPQVTSSPPPQTLLFGPQPTFWDFKNSAIISRQEYTVPGDVTGGLFSDVVSEEDSHIRSGEKRVATVRGHGTSIGPSNDIVPEEYKQIASDANKVPTARGRDTAVLPPSGAASAVDKQVTSDENMVPMGRIDDTAVAPLSDVASAEDKQITSDDERVPKSQGRDTDIEPVTNVASAEYQQSTSDQRMVPVARSSDTAVAPVNDVASAEDAQTTSDEKGVAMAQARDEEIELFNAVVSTEEKQITSDQKKLPAAPDRDTDMQHLNNDAVHAKNKQMTADEKSVPVARARDTVVGPFNDVVPAKDNEIASVKKGELLVPSPDTDVAPLNEVTSTEGKELNIEEQKTPMEPGRDTVVGPLNDIVSAEDKQITSDENKVPKTRGSDTGIEPFNDVASAEEKQIISDEKSVPMARSHDAVVGRINEIVSAEGKQIISDAKTEPEARGHDTAVGGSSDVISAEDKHMISEEKRGTMERGRDTSVGNLAAEETLQVQASTTGVLAPTKTGEGENLSISEAARPPTPGKRSPFPGMVLNREENEVPADNAQEPNTVILRAELSNMQLPPDIETNLQGTAAEEKIIPVTLAMRSPPVSHLDAEFNGQDSASGPSVTKSVDPSQQHSPANSTSPPHTPLHGLLPPFWDDRKSALITRQQYTVPGETTGGPFSASERTHSGEFGSPKLLESRFTADCRTAAEASRPTEQSERVSKTTKRRSSWADSSQSQLRLPNLVRSPHSSVDLSPPGYGDLARTSSRTAFLSEIVTVGEDGGNATRNDNQRPEYLSNTEPPGQAVLPSPTPPLPQYVDPSAPLLPTAEHTVAVTAPAELPTLATSASTDQHPPAEAISLQAGTKAVEVSLLRDGSDGREVNDKSEPRSGREQTPDLLRSYSPTSKGSNDKSPSEVIQNNGSITSSVSPRDRAVDRRHWEPPLAISADQQELVASSAQQTSVDSGQQRSSVPVDTESKGVSSVERLKGQLQAAPDRALIHPVTKPGVRELEPLPSYGPTISSRLPPHWTPIERRKQELLANAKLSGELKSPPNRALARPATDSSADDKSAQRGLATPTSRQADADSVRHPKWFPIERPNQELSDRKRNGKLSSPGRAIPLPIQEQLVDVSVQQRESAIAQASQVDPGSRQQPKWIPAERASQGAPPYAENHGQQRLPLPVSRHLVGTRPDKGELITASQPASADIDDSKLLTVHSTASPARPEARSRNGRELIPAYDNSATVKVRPSDKLEHGVFVTPVAEQPSPSEAGSSRRLATSPDVFFRETSPVSAQGSKDLITFKPEETSDAQAPRSPEEKWTRRPKDSATVDKKDDSAEESKK